MGPPKCLQANGLWFIKGLYCLHITNGVQLNNIAIHKALLNLSKGL